MRKLPLLIAGLLAIGFAGAAEKERVLFFSAHPDDIISSLGTCLLMRDKFEVHVCDYSYGAVPGDPLKAVREKEELAVCAAIGAKHHWYGCHQGETWVVKDEVERLAALLKELKPRAVFGHWPIDVHPTHMLSAAVLQRAVNLARLDCEFYFFEESFDSKGFPDVHYVDITSVAKEKERIIRLYRSQNPDDKMCREEMENCKFRGRRLAAIDPASGLSIFDLASANPDGADCIMAEAFAPYVGRPQGRPCIFSEIPRSLKGTNK